MAHRMAQILVTLGSLLLLQLTKRVVWSLCICRALLLMYVVNGHGLVFLQQHCHSYTMYFQFYGWCHVCNDTGDMKRVYTHRLSGTVCLQLLEILEIYWNLKTLLEISLNLMVLLEIFV